MCVTGKIPYPSADVAQATIDDMKRRGHRGGRKRDKLLQVYQCRSCPALHIGHTKRRFRKAGNARGHAA